ncbi:MAG TPA: hypothetical protein DEA47_05840 [Peptococcaceae bacterium]|nr:MAG: hypothetical protein XD50_0799 [Clostridia bacterium 41_269]HBT20863.1 hypothetical protein [Peptococcaceae bacterium]
MTEEYIPQEIMRGKIIATKSLVKKQIRAIKEIEGEVDDIILGINSEEIEREKVKELAKKFREFQICVENAFVFIAENFDGGVPKTENIHKSLLEQMGKEIENSRPSVIDSFLAQNLDEYIDLRLDVEKDPEAFNDAARVKTMLNNYKKVSESAQEQLLNFFDELEKFHGLKNS